ncbi:hypothetical protein [Legionella israelensis]|uniref:hypothetical protein n=1 Tax=Legionella israelensis TaxID=454 RepID=UPI001FD73FF9|nr:hypothetical protein [Legionella israelensis]
MNVNLFINKLFSKFSIFKLTLRQFSISAGICLLFFVNINYASERYFVCGPDEDGCYKDIYHYCACIPYDDEHAQTPYCLDFNKLTCSPLEQVPDCDPGMIYKNQGSCLATIFQSESEPPCPVRNHSFCLENDMAICDANGRPESCRYVAK